MLFGRLSDLKTALEKYGFTCQVTTEVPDQLVTLDPYGFWPAQDSKQVLTVHLRSALVGCFRDNHSPSRACYYGCIHFNHVYLANNHDHKLEEIETGVARYMSKGG